MRQKKQMMPANSADEAIRISEAGRLGASSSAGMRCLIAAAINSARMSSQSFFTKRRDKKAALRVLRKSLQRHGHAERIVTDRLAFYGAALRQLGAIDKREVGRWLNNRVENSHQPFRRRERAMLRFRHMRSLQKFAALHGSIHNHFNQERHLSSRPTFKERRTAVTCPRIFGPGII